MVAGHSNKQALMGNYALHHPERISLNSQSRLLSSRHTWQAQVCVRANPPLQPLQRQYLLARSNKLRPRLQALLWCLQAVLDTVVDAEQIGPRER